MEDASPSNIAGSVALGAGAVVATVPFPGNTEFIEASSVNVKTPRTVLVGSSGPDRGEAAVGKISVSTTGRDELVTGTSVVNSSIGKVVTIVVISGSGSGNVLITGRSIVKASVEKVVVINSIYGSESGNAVA